ncbi:MAG: hypothetical protein H0T46_34585 [Deltaproteobacteria bacterium]|nr:hypothetical protein [Deltaproteobacteria bacterium]
MSRLAIAFALVTSLTTSVFASSAGAQFARPPAAQVELRAEARMPMRYLDRAVLRAKLLERRAQNLAHFRAYQKKGTFPANTFLEGELNVWVDDFGNICAAASIIKASGNVELVKRVGDETNFIRLGDVEQGPLMDWMLTSGFTKEEIVAIQRPMAYIGDERQQLNRPFQLAETERLKKLYKTVERSLLKGQKKSIELAVTRLMQNPDLAWKLLDS